MQRGAILLTPEVGDRQEAFEPLDNAEPSGRRARNQPGIRPEQLAGVEVGDAKISLDFSGPDQRRLVAKELQRVAFRVFLRLLWRGRRSRSVGGRRGGRRG